ncbi:MAG: SUMF1/EgtB/PvdO family nonheme iron enzyme [Verrucomicrobia bacterium]|nr:SUMF1/EgtB/PvdO family nonheme iron enzyme [Verrucomicrobiota bacterium]
MQKAWISALVLLSGSWLLPLAADDFEIPLLISCEACQAQKSKKSEICLNCGHPTADSVSAIIKEQKRLAEEARLAEEKIAEEKIRVIEKKERKRIEELAKPRQIASSAAYKKFGDNFTIPELSLEMIWVKPGTFMMGSPKSEESRKEDEVPHQVNLTHGFYLGKYEVTEEQYEKVTGQMGYQPKGANYPVQGIIWSAALEFCNKLTEFEANNSRLLEGMVYSLPSEAQWEYACRAGSTTSYSWGNGISVEDANFYATSDGEVKEIGQFKPNSWGFYDMHGNVSEWTSDLYRPYRVGPISDPELSILGRFLVGRGGSFWCQIGDLRSANRIKGQDSRILSGGFGLRIAYRPK